MKILVTGGAGFIGSWIADEFSKLGHNVVIIDNLSTGKEINLPENVKFYPLDICSNDIEKIFRSEKFDIVNHHAAQVDLRISIDDPIYDVNVNVIGTINLLNASVKYGVKRFTFASSGGAIYDESFGFPSKENMDSIPPTPYGINKLSSEKYLNYFMRMCGLSYISLRYSNVYGPRQTYSKESGVISIFVNSMLNSNPINIYGDGEQTRDFLYVEDVVRANMIALDSDKTGWFNISTNKATSINQIFHYLREITDYKDSPQYLPERNCEVKHSRLSFEKAKKILSFEPIFNIEDGLKKTVEYYK